ncbi:TRADD-N-associated membrane domain-containing protein [Blastococcus jejuensis]
MTPEKQSEPRIDLWVNSPEREWYIQRLGLAHRLLYFVGFIGLLAWVLASPTVRTPDSLWWAAILGAVAVVTTCFCAIPYLAGRGAYRDRRRQTAAFRADEALFRLEPGRRNPASPDPHKTSPNSAEDLPLAALFTLNRRQLDAYQELTQRQQRSAFRLTQVTSIVGLLVLITGVVLAFLDVPAVNKYVAGGLAGLGALLSAFLSNTFYQAHRAADRQLNWYYREPHSLGKLLIAERISAAMGCDEATRSSHATAMITELLRWTLPDDAADARSDGAAPPTTPGGASPTAPGGAPG